MVHVRLSFSDWKIAKIITPLICWPICIDASFHRLFELMAGFFSSWNIKRPIHFIVRNQIPMPTKNWRNKKYAFFIITIIFLDCFCCCWNSEFVCQSNEKWWKLLRYFYGYISLLLGVIISWWKSVNKDIYSFEKEFCFSHFVTEWKEDDLSKKKKTEIIQPNVDGKPTLRFWCLIKSDLFNCTLIISSL